jgi:RNA polymerase sigma-70 factor (ECF subfamily)
MAAAIRPKFDSEDFAQAVWQSVFCSRDRLLTADTQEAFRGLLVKIARNKVVDELRRRLVTTKYDVNREDDSSPDIAAGMMTSTPSQIFIASETLEQLLANEPEHYQQVVRMRVDGCSQREIADETGISERTVRRVLARLLKENSAQLNGND